MSKTVVTKASPEAISIGSGLIVGGLLEILGINNNKVIYGIPNFIPSPSNLLYVVKRSYEDTFIEIAGFVCNYPCSMSCDKREHAEIGRLVKKIDFWDDKRVQ